jgi:hypothetical protein
MYYTNFANNVIRRYKVDLVGWPFPELKSSSQMTQAQVEEILGLLTAKPDPLLFFVKLSKQEVARKLKELDAAESDSDSENAATTAKRLQTLKSTPSTRQPLAPNIELTPNISPFDWLDRASELGSALSHDEEYGNLNSWINSAVIFPAPTDFSDSPVSDSFFI